MGPLAGFRIIEMAGIGPAPFAATLLADMGAEVIRIDRREAADLGLPGREPKFDVLHRGRRSLALDVKAEAGRAVVKQLAAKADALIEGFRPGVMERLGLGPEELLKLNPKLVFGRMTGFGQDGPLAQAAGHDINYIALAGVLHAIGRKGEAPVPPLNLVGDFGGGGMFLAFGVLCGLLEAQKSGKGQVVDAAMVDGAAYLLAGIYGLYSQGTGPTSAASTSSIPARPGTTSTRPRTASGCRSAPSRSASTRSWWRSWAWPRPGCPSSTTARAGPICASASPRRSPRKTRDEWERIFEGSDACVAPVLALGEVESHPHNVARGTFVRRDGVLQPGPAPRFSRTAMRDGAAGPPRAAPTARRS